MLFQEIMRLEPFEGATVLVGDTRGEHQVKAVYVSDGSNIPEKAERGGAFFVCDTAFGDKNNKEFDDNLKNYIDCLTDKQAAGLIIEKHTEMAEITEDIVSYAAKKGIPLIIIPYETAVTQAVPQLYYSLFEDRNRQDESNLFMKELLYGDEQHAILRLANFNYKNEKQHIAIFFSFDKTDFDGKMVEELALVMPINLSLTLFSVVYPDEDGVVVVLELSQKEPVKDIVNRFLSAVQHDMGDKLNGNTVSAGVSSIFYKPERMKECIDEAKKAMRLLRGYNICHSARYFEEIGIYRFFFELGNDVELEDFMMQRLGELISYDKENNSDYIDTLETYLDFGCNIGETAEYLYMHRNTIRYRITRVEEILGIDLNSAGTRFNLRFAFKIRKYLRQSE